MAGDDRGDPSCGARGTAGAGRGRGTPAVSRRLRGSLRPGALEPPLPGRLWPRHSRLCGSSLAPFPITAGVPPELPVAAAVPVGTP